MNRGLQLEKEFITFFNNKTILDFNLKWQKHIKRMFPNIKKRNVIKAKKYKDSYAKCDIVLMVKDQRVLLSIKTGHNPTMHCERFTGFYTFLKDIGVSRDTLNTLVLYHFGSSKKYGYEEKPLSKEEIVEKYSNKIKRANEELNSEEIIKAVVKRSVTKGCISTRESINFLYYGTIERGLLISRKQAYESILSRRYINDSFIQFGELVYQPASRTRENNRYLETTIHWPVLSVLFYKVRDEDDVVNSRPKNFYGG